MLSQSVWLPAESLEHQITRELHKEFAVDSDVLIGVQNKHGDITITTWERDLVVVDVMMRVKCSSASKGQTFIDGIMIEFAESREKLGMKTVYPDQDNSSWYTNWWSNDNNIKYEVHYVIKAPVNMSSHLITKYGNINQTNIGGSSDVTNKYGNIILGNLDSDLTLDLGYGKATVGSIKRANIDTKHSSLSIDKCTNMRMDSKHSTFNFGNCGALALTSKHDNFSIRSCERLANEGKYDVFQIEQVGQISIESKSSNIDIKKLTHHGTFETSRGIINVQHVDSGVQLHIESKYTDVSLGLGTDFCLNYYGDQTELSLNDAECQATTYIKDGSELHIKTCIGDQDRASKIKAEMRYGSLKIH